MDTGMLVMARRRSALGFYTAEQRMIPARHIADVCREGSSVRVDLRGDSRHRTYFQFWADDASIAGTIVRMLPTMHTVGYEGSAAPSVYTRKDLAKSGHWFTRILYRLRLR
jgi:hypothetical protein